MRITAEILFLLPTAILAGCSDSTQVALEPERPSMIVGGSSDRVHGSGFIPALNARFRVSAHSGPLGEDPNGHMDVEFPGGSGGVEFTSTKGRIICLAVLGNRASMTMVSEDFPTGIFLVVEDNGNGALPDRADVALGINPDPATAPCAGQLLFPIFFPIEGDVVVNDALTGP